MKAILLAGVLLGASCVSAARSSVETNYPKKDTHGCPRCRLAQLTGPDEDDRELQLRPSSRIPPADQATRPESAQGS